MTIDFAYFNTEALKFIEIMGNKNYTVEQCSKALAGLLTVYLNTEYQNENERTKAERLIRIVTTEHDRRLALRLLYNI